MEFWTENQGQSPLYSEFGTVPGRNCASNYLDRHQATQYPLYYSAQQDQVREPSYWTAQSRTGWAKHEYTNWTDQDLTSSASAQFPFILNRHPQDMGEYQLHDARDREWTAAQRATREYERGYLQEGWQRRWEPCSPVRYNQEVLTKRSDNSYRELEAWAARYSHSLPRRKRIEAELRGASQGLQETSAPERAYIRSATDPRVAALQQVLQSASTRERELWDRGGRQQGPTHGLSQTLTRNVSHMLDTKEKASNQKRILSQPPGYIAPPPYNSPHKSSPALIKSDTSLREVKGQSNWLQPKLEKRDISVDSHSLRKVEKENLTQPDATQEILLELEGLKQRRQEKGAVQATCPNNTQKTNIEHEGMMPLQQLQVLQAFQNKKTKEGSSTKVIEGRKFRLNKKTGGMTIFCLVSRIASTTEIQSLPLSHSNPNTHNTESVAHSTDLKDHSVNKLADEVDFTQSVPALQEQTKTSASRNLQAKQKKRQMCAEEMLKDCSETSVTGVSLQAVQPVMVKYPLWREPGSTSRAETESLSACLEVNSEKGKSEVQQNQKDFLKVQPIDIEVRRLDITKAKESEDSKGLLVIDTTCVLVKMELIQSPKKEHVHFLHSKPQTEDSELDKTSTVPPEVVQSNSQNQDWPSDPDSDPPPFHEGLGTEVEPDLGEKKEPEKETEISFSCMLKSSVPDKETMAERAERILGIPLQDCMTDLPLGDASTCHNLFVESQKVDPPQIGGEDNCDAAHKIQEEKKDEEKSQNLTEVNQTEDAVYLHEDYDAKDHEGQEGSQEFPGIQEQVSDMPDEMDDVSLKTDSKCSFEQEMTEVPVLETNGDGSTEQNQDKNQPVSSPHNELIPLNSVGNDTPSEIAPQSHNQSQLSLSLMANEFSQTSTAHTDQSPNSPPLDLADQTAEALSTGAEDQADWGESSQSIADEISSALEKDMTEERVSLTTEQHEDASSMNESNVGDEQHTEQADKDPKDNTMEDAREINISQQKNECVPGEEIACVKEMYFPEEQPPNEVIEDLPGLISEETFNIPTESASDQLEIECVHAEDVVCAKDSSTTNEHPEEVYNDHTDVLQNTPDSLMETRNVQDTEPHYEAPNSSELYPSSNASHNELVPPLEISSASLSAQNPDVDADAAGGIPETFPSPILLESCEADIHPPSPSDIPPVQHPSSSPQEGCKRSSPDVTLTEPLRYPTSLRDAVSRIRKHTAPDSENEEEEVSELWELESTGEDQGCQDEEESLKMREMVFDEAGKQAYTDESDDEVKQNSEQHGNRDEDTLSCSSTSSHSSDDTVIEADDDDECEESKPDDGAEIQESEREQSFSCAVTDKTRAKNEEDEGLKDESE